uniref:Ku70/Ku80 C-terminal arm domain-containing protein n=1 Tax=Brassica oleracea TaxID=3712 RepID=A0A3P6CAE9_BRAOL|nr:unnamed protein product [Brassica oleracea]
MPTREEFLCFLQQKPIGDGTPNLLLLTKALLSTKPGQYQRHTDTIKFDTPLDFSVCQFANPGMLKSPLRHYAILQAIALDEDELRETRDETLPDKEGMNRPGVVKAIEEFKKSIYGDDSGEESDSGEKKGEIKKA